MDENKMTDTEELKDSAAAPVAQPVPEAEQVSEEAVAAQTPTETAVPQPEAPVAEAEMPDEPEEAAEAEVLAEKPLPKDKTGIIERLKEIIHEGANVDRAELENLKQAYYKLRNSEVAAAREAFVANGGASEDFVPVPDPEEENFKAQMGLVREMRAKAIEETEKEKQENLQKKLAIIERIKEMTASPEQADKSYDEFKRLQAEWKEIKLVPAEKSTELWKNYQLYVEQFYDVLRLNHEFRAYDFKKNLEIKTRLCEAAERLAEVNDPVSAFHQLQKLHQEFREAGPVAKEFREEIWNRFKAASTLVNKRHQEHFEKLKAQEEENLAKKTELCERIEAIDIDALKTFADWDKKTKEILEIQAQWKSIGFTPRKMNTKIFERFRSACDNFFKQKAEHFKSMREGLAANLAAKTALCEQAEALKESTEWNATGNKLIQLQKEWKAIGPVAHKVSDAVWKRFNAACNYFFERKNEATSGQRQEEDANFEKKTAIIDELEKLLAAPGEDARQTARDLMSQWNETGHVPFRKKDKLYKRYHETLDRVFAELHISAGRRNLEGFKKNVADKGGSELTRERDRLTRAYEAKKAEIQNYETNLMFFNSKSQSGNSLLEEVTRKIERLKSDLDLLVEKINAVNEQIKNEGEA